jgi:MAX-like protein X
MNSLNETNNLMSLTNAEQKRRCNIQHGFDRLQILVPSLRDKNAKVSKAVMLQKTSDYIKELQKAKDQRVADLNLYKREIEDLSNKITDCQNQLPASGVSVTGNLNRMEKFEQKFNNYVKEKTLENWKFYLFSIFLKPLFDNFVSNVNTSSKENIERTFYEWQDR